MPVYKDGKKFYFTVNYKDLNGSYKKYKSKRYDTKREAEKAEAEYRVSISLTSSSSKTFNDMIVEYLYEKKKTVKPQTYSKLNTICNNHISGLIGKIKIEKLTKTQYELFKKKIEEKGFCLRYNNWIHNVVIALVKLARKNYGVYSNVPEICGGFTSVEYKPQKKIDFYTYDEFKTFISVVDEIKWHALFTTLYYCGLRLGEANALTWNDIDFEANTIDINKTVNTKMNDGKGNHLLTTPKTKSSIRVLPMPKHVINDLKELYEYYSKFDGFSKNWYVFGGLKSLSETTIHVYKNKYCNQVNLKPIRVHDFRHSCASLLINMGANITVVSQYLGHANVSTTLNIYSHFYKSKLDEVISVIDSL